ncbi:hypothetical protein AAVH_29999, partial [Aphelenchoides avenae]
MSQVPEALQQRCFEAKKSSTEMPLGVPLSKKDGYDRGGFLTEGGIETKYYWTSLAGKISVWQYDRGPANVQLLFEYAFGPVATVIDAAFFRLN